MARTRAMRAVLALAERAAATDAVTRQTIAPRLSRRSLLTGVSATAGLALLTSGRSPHALAQATPTSGAPRIGIVGAGIAGLTTTLALHDAGYASTLFDAAASVGGRMHSNTTSWRMGKRASGAPN